MALFLKAEQKNLLQLFGTDEVFIIPPFQRPYSWGYEECDRIYNDLTDAYNNKTEYFLGNIVIASSKSEDLRPHVIDGQQRLITLFMIAKILTTLCPEFVKFSRLIYVEDDLGQTHSPKIESNVLERPDNSSLQKIMALTSPEIENRVEEVSHKGTLLTERCEGTVEANFLLLYNWFSKYKQRAKQDEFNKYIDFFFRKIYILPITLNGETISEAESDALTIFETINDRGMSLQDADIIKALLYKRAKEVGQESDFIRKWENLTTDCIDLNTSIDDLFRYYYYLIKDKSAYTSDSNSNKLRDYFVRNTKSPLLVHSTNHVISELNKIIQILQYMHECAYSSDCISILLQIINSYTNQYPRYAIVAYLYENGIDNIEATNFVKFLLKIIRLSYGSGSTTAIKSEIFSIIRAISFGDDIDDYYFSKELDILNAKRVFPLRKGLLLLNLWLSTPDPNIGEKKIGLDRIMPKKDFVGEEPIGNFFLIEGSPKKGNWERKFHAYKNSMPILFERQFSTTCVTSNTMVKNRTELINTTLSKFFYIQ